MNIVNMEWKVIERKYGSNPFYLYLNKIHVATVSWDIGCSRYTNLTHRVDIHLPGLKSEIANQVLNNETTAKEYAENVVKRWVELAGLEFK